MASGGMAVPAAWVAMVAMAVVPGMAAPDPVAVRPADRRVDQGRQSPERMRPHPSRAQPGATGGAGGAAIGGAVASDGENDREFRHLLE